ncbi:7517_t:CDS:1, partial [Cetraspora pellucida]
MFYTGTANLRQKMTAQQMHEELMIRVQNSELEQVDVPKIT